MSTRAQGDHFSGSLSRGSCCLHPHKASTERPALVFYATGSTFPIHATSHKASHPCISPQLSGLLFLISTTSFPGHSFTGLLRVLNKGTFCYVGVSEDLLNIVGNGHICFSYLSLHDSNILVYHCGKISIWNPYTKLKI